MKAFLVATWKTILFLFPPKWLGNWIAPISPEATLQKKEEALKKIQFCSSENLVFCWGSLLWFSMHHWRFWIQYVVLLIRLFFRWTNKMSDWRYTTQWRSTCRPYWLIDIWSQPNAAQMLTIVFMITDSFITSDNCQFISLITNIEKRKNAIIHGVRLFLL